jgi:hypothetical protein
MASECVETILDLMREAEEHYGVQVGLVIIDTYAKGIAIGGGDEDKARTKDAASPTCGACKKPATRTSRLWGTPARTKAAAPVGRMHIRAMLT